MTDVTLTEDQFAILAAAVTNGREAASGFLMGFLAAHVAAAEREALERAVQAIEALPTTRTQAFLTGWESVSRDDALAVVRDLMPRKDGE